MNDTFNNMNDWEIRKALYLQNVALDLHIDLSDCEIGVNQSSGNVYLFSYDLPYQLYMPISCELTKDDVWILTTDNMDGAEYETTLNDKTFNELETWSYQMRA